MYITADEVKESMDLEIHHQIADFINEHVANSQTMYLEDLEMELRALLSQEVIDGTISDVGVGISLAINEVRKLISQFEEELESIKLAKEQLDNQQAE